MRGSEFLAANASKSLSQWEAAVIALASQDSFVQWPMVPVVVSTKDGKHTGRFFVASDYFAIGIPEDYIRLPLTPSAAQSVANLNSMFLPTSKMVDDIARISSRLTPQPLVPNKGANLAQYAEHSRLIDQQITTLPLTLSPFEAGTRPLTGHKKDVIISNIWKPGKVVIYGWHRPDGTYIQPKSNIHGDFYVDYSHGIRLVSPNMEIDGQSMSVEDVLKSSEYAPLIRSEGPIRRVRYPALNIGTPRISYYDLGAATLIALSQRAA